MSAYQEDSISIALPSEIPEPPRLANLPAHILHSGTVETLMAQSDDLMARLKVSLRRNAVLEQRILILDEQASQAKQAIENMYAEADLAREHEVTLVRKIRESEEQFSAINTELKRSLQEQGARTADLTLSLQEREAMISDLRGRLSETITQLQSQQKQFQKDQAALVNRYEEKEAQGRQELEQLQNEILLHRERSVRLENIAKKQIDSENRAILAERRLQELEKRFSSELETLQAKTAAYRLEAKTVIVELQSAQNEIKDAKEYKIDTEEKIARLEDQFESLQALWADNQKQLEESKLKQESLSRINHELSLKLKDQRRALDNQVALTPLSNTSSAQEERISIAIPSNISRLSFSDKQSGQMNRMESLLNEIQSGFPMSRPQFATELAQTAISANGQIESKASETSMESSVATDSVS
jgi:chromosome segregation ATPase